MNEYLFLLGLGLRAEAACTIFLRAFFAVFPDLLFLI